MAKSKSGKPARAKKVKDLDPKAKGKGVKGGWSGPGKSARKVTEAVGKSINRSLNDPS